MPKHYVHSSVFLVAQTVKNLPATWETLRSPEEGNGNPLQNTCLENFMDRGAWRAMVHRVKKSDMTERLWHVPSRWEKAKSIQGTFRVLSHMGVFKDGWHVPNTWVHTHSFLTPEVHLVSCPCRFCASVPRDSGDIHSECSVNRIPA